MSSQRRVLLTGGAGFIGSHVAEALLQSRCELAIIDSLDDFYSPEVKQRNLREISKVGSYRFFQEDIRNADALKRIFAETEPDAVIHLAAYAGVRPSIMRPLSYEQVNIGGTLNVLELMHEFRVKKLVFASSSSIYGDSATVPFSEKEPQMHPISPYAATKLACEMLVYTYAHLYDISTVCLRFFTVYGPRQRPDLAIHKFVALMEAGESIPVFGNGTAGRDYTYIDDIVAGVLAALNFQPSSSDGAAFDVFNLGNSNPVSLNTLISLLEDITGKAALRVVMPSQPGDVAMTWADIAKAAQLLGYKPGTELRVGLERFVAWYRQNNCVNRTLR
jgi:UDP-glucuronate 4-epimerase